ncbi:Arc family DNA-binding protein [Devosia crocina]|uniref:Arc family DNA-binding protein n=1 Tax=Devosia crocina TaxID=429728 RepID=UPI001FCD3A36|nr:Arc family DNA-binding protein [Devosia crocina]
MVQESESRVLDKVIVRLPDGMRDQLKAAASEVGRSMNAEIVARLEASFEIDEAGGKQGFMMGELSAQIANSISMLKAEISRMSNSLEMLTEENKFLREELSAMYRQASEHRRSEDGY